MAYTATVTKLTNIRPHPNADKVKLATVFGNQVVIGLNNTESELGLYFQVDGQLSEEFCKMNNLFRNPELNNDPKEKPGMFDENRRIRAQKFRGEVSDGFWIPISSVSYINGLELTDGLDFTSLGGHLICERYITKQTRTAGAGGGKTAKSANKSIMFKEHFDTAHLGKNLHRLELGQRLVITAKLHGTSSRVGRVQVNRTLTWKDKLSKFIGGLVSANHYAYLNGTRRTVINESKYKQPFHDPSIRDQAAKLFEGKLHKGETVYLEIVGYEPSGAPIMGRADTTKMNDKAFTAKYGKVITYSYGCEEKTCDFYVYRITMTNEDGIAIDLPWDDLVSRCNTLDVKHVPLIAITTLDSFLTMDGDVESARQSFMSYIDKLCSRPCSIDPRHIEEGVCVSIDNLRITPAVFKHKSFEFKVLEGIVKDSGVIDQEEVEDIA